MIHIMLYASSPHNRLNKNINFLYSIPFYSAVSFYGCIFSCWWSIKIDIEFKTRKAINWELYLLYKLQGLSLIQSLIINFMLKLIYFKLT